MGGKRPRRETQARVIGGVVAARNTYPWMGSMQDSLSPGTGHFCGVTLIAPKFAMSAGHCLESIYWAERLVFNTTDLEDSDNDVVASVATVHYPPNYAYPPWSSGRANVRDDLIVLELDEEVEGVEPVRLNWNETSGLERAGRALTIVGWGYTYETTDNQYTSNLREATVPVVDLAACNATYEGLIFDTNLCAGNGTTLTNTCVGDSGGPIFGEDAQGVVRQVGVTSWGARCDHAESVGVYASTLRLGDWITSVTGLEPEAAASLAPTASPSTPGPTSPHQTLAPSRAPTTRAPTISVDASAGSGTSDQGAGLAPSHAGIIAAVVCALGGLLVVAIVLFRRRQHRRQSAAAGGAAQDPKLGEMPKNSKQAESFAMPSAQQEQSIRSV